MKTTLPALLILVAILSTTGCIGRQSPFAAWPFRNDAAAANFAANGYSPSADPFLSEEARLQNGRMMSQGQTRQPGQPHASQGSPQHAGGAPAVVRMNAGPFPGAQASASHQQTASTQPTSTTVTTHPFPTTAQQSQWQSRTAAKIQ